MLWRDVPTCLLSPSSSWCWPQRSCQTQKSSASLLWFGSPFAIVPCMLWPRGIGSAAALPVGSVSAHQEVIDILCWCCVAHHLQLSLRSCTWTHSAPPYLHPAVNSELQSRSSWCKSALMMLYLLSPWGPANSSCGNGADVLQG